MDVRKHFEQGNLVEGVKELCVRRKVRGVSLTQLLKSIPAICMRADGAGDALDHMAYAAGGLRSGDVWGEQIVRAIHPCNVSIVLVSSASITSSRIWEEIRLAWVHLSGRMHAPILAVLRHTP